LSVTTTSRGRLCQNREIGMSTSRIRCWSISHILLNIPCARARRSLTHQLDSYAANDSHIAPSREGTTSVRPRAHRTRASVSSAHSHTPHQLIVRRRAVGPGWCCSCTHVQHTCCTVICPASDRLQVRGGMLRARRRCSVLATCTAADWTCEGDACCVLRALQWRSPRSHSVARSTLSRALLLAPR
jgi:hypothetical protein